MSFLKTIVITDIVSKNNMTTNVTFYFNIIFLLKGIITDCFLLSYV